MGHIKNRILLQSLNSKRSEPVDDSRGYNNDSTYSRTATDPKFTPSSFVLYIKIISDHQYKNRMQAIVS
jgi:hypothetical protein